MVIAIEESNFHTASNFQAEHNGKLGKFDDHYKDRYPRGLDLTPGHPLHEKIKAEILIRARESERFMQPRHPKWRKLDHTLQSFIRLDKEEERLKQIDDRTPVSIVVPETYATRDTLLTYQLAAFGISPTFGYSPMGPEDVIGAALLEKQVDYQVQRSKALLTMHTQWGDGFTYGVGAVAPSWTVETGRRSFFDDLGYFDPLTGEFVKTGSERRSEDTILYEGNRLDAIDPYLLLPDPTVPIHEPQSGEYFGWLDTSNYMALRRREAEPGSTMFNVRYLRGTSGRSDVYKHNASGRDEQLPNRDHIEDGNRNIQPVDTIWMYIDLLPEEWDLGRVEEPEKWLFALSGDEVITQCHPMELDHNMFPVAVCAPDFGGHELLPISRLETMYGLQGVADFYINSHVEFARRALRYNLVVDPKLINYRDALEGNGIIRVRKALWGRGIKDGIEQLQLQDVTQNHMGDLASVLSLSRQGTGAADSVQGLQRQGGERVTKAEFQDTRGAALSRLQKAARIISLQSMNDLARLFAYHTQQFMTEDTYVQVAGSTEQMLRAEYGITDDFARVTPFDINISFDIKVHDGSVLGGENISDWIQLYQAVLQNPEAAAQIDSTRMLLHVARLMKVANPFDFLKKEQVNVEVQSDEAVEDQVQQGNFAPIGEVG